MGLKKGINTLGEDYVVYHLHSILSNGVTNIDSITKYEQYIEYAKSLGMKAMAFSEHGSVFEWLKKKEAIEKAGMKYIHASEFYVTKTTEEKIRDNKHCILIARNYDGVKELNKLSSISFNRDDGHFYYVPRITIDELCSTSNNIIVTTACLGGILPEGDDEMRRKFIDFLIENKERCFLEIQHHKDEYQIKYNQYLLKFHNEYGIPLIAGTDTHALNEEHMEGRRILQKAKKIYFENEEGWDLTFKTYDELVKAYFNQGALPMDVVKEAINNTNVMADMVEEFTMDRSYKYPHLWDNPRKLLIQKIKQGIKTRGVDKYPNRQEYADRVWYELKAYEHNQAIDFMLLMEDIVAWCRTQDIQVGYGRGSVNGSIIAWLLGITEMDSIKYGLNFERFMNVERVSLSDIDTDFPPSRIEEVKQYIFNHPGLYCSDIITFNTIADKGAIRDVGRALEIPLSTVDEICNAVDNEEEYAKVRTEYPELFKYVDLVKGVVVSIGNHPCGMVVSPHPLDDAVGLCSTSTDSCPISQLYMKEVDSLNYVKLDLLKLDTIELISDTCKMSNIPMILPDTLDIEDIDVWNSMRDDTTCIFQWEGNTGNDYIKKLLSDENIKAFKDAGLDIDRMTLLSIGNSAIRPAGASYRDDLASGIIRTTGSKPIDDFLSNTFGYLVFQCQIIDFLHLYCGFTMGEADLVRRGFAKKTGTDQYIPIIKNGGYLTDKSTHHIDGFIKTMKDTYDISEEKSEEDIVAFIQVIEDASAYLFSLNHSQPYSFEGYACAWLRYYYPVEFLTCALNINTDNETKTIAITNYAKKNNISIKAPKFRHSQARYSCDPANKIIYKGILSIKYMNANIADELYTLKDNQYDSFIDLLKDINDLSIDSRQLDILIKLNFFEEFDKPNALLKQLEMYNEIATKKQIKLEKTNIPMFLITKYCNKVTEKMAKDFDAIELLKAWIKATDMPKTTVLDQINYESEHLGYIQTVLSNLNKDYYYVQNITNNWVELYQLHTGDTLKIKFRKNDWNKNPFNEKQIIRVISINDEQKFIKNPDGTWGRSEELEPILKKWSICS